MSTAKMTFSQINGYYHLAKPGIIYGNLVTATAGFLFASHWHGTLQTYVSMIVGISLVIGSACVFNNVIDKDIDGLMERTKKRATVTGKIADKQALTYATSLLLIGSIVLLVFTNVLTFFVGLSGFIIYVGIYTYAKRKTVYAALIGSLAGAVPPLAGYTSYTNYIDLAGIMLFLILVCWQLTHFYAIALYRKQEYKTAGVPVWPIVKGDWNAQLYAIGFIGLFTIFSLTLFIIGTCGWVYLVTVLILGLGWLWYSVILAAKLSAKAWGRKIFISSLVVILIISVALSLGPVLP